MQRELIFCDDVNDSFVIFTSAVTRRLNRFRQTGVQRNEGGGVLLGSRRGRHIAVSLITTPKLGDKAGRFGFSRNSTFHRRFAVRAWLRFGRKLDYVGEWHTHPERYPQPSALDRAEWAKLARRARAPMIFLILGISSVWAGISENGVRPLTEWFGE
jgi:integrative and conjugative element protein (TIGR02256 family)